MIWYLLLTLFFVFCQGFFSGMETGMVSVLRPRAEHAARNGSWQASLLLAGQRRIRRSYSAFSGITCRRPTPAAASSL